MGKKRKRLSLVYIIETGLHAGTSQRGSLSVVLACLLALSQAYDHAYDVVQCYRWLPMGAEVLVQVRS